MFKPCPNCGFLVALIRGREASQRCPRCGSALVEATADTLDPARGEPAAVNGLAPRTDAATGVPSLRRPRTDAAAVDPLQHPDDSSARSTPDVRRDAHAPTAGETMSSDAGKPRAEASSWTTASVPHDAPADEATAGVAAAQQAHAAAAMDPALPEVDKHDEASAPRAHDAPTFARRVAARRTAGARRWPAIAATAALALLLAVQLLLAQRHELARDARWRPVVAAACSVLGCVLPPWREPAAFAMLARGVRPDPRRPGVLRVTTTVRNDAQWPQPLPVVVLQLSDIDGRVVGARAVPPRDYAGASEALVAPRASVDIAFDVREPAARVVSFDFQLK
ncbi:DUF3426 domain-containing protein [Lysobacter humi (ex Lee et al. 2017)]